MFETKITKVQLMQTICFTFLRYSHCTILCIYNSVSMEYLHQSDLCVKDPKVMTYDDDSNTISSSSKNPSEPLFVGTPSTEPYLL